MGVKKGELIMSKRDDERENDETTSGTLHSIFANRDTRELMRLVHDVEDTFPDGREAVAAAAAITVACGLKRGLSPEDLAEEVENAAHIVQNATSYGGVDLLPEPPAGFCEHRWEKTTCLLCRMDS